MIGLALLASCWGGGQKIPPVTLDDAPTAVELRRKLEEIASRSDHEASIGRARIYDRLRRLAAADPSDLLARGDAADVELLSQPAPPEYKAESARRLSAHFLERAADPGLRRGEFPGPLGEAIYPFVLLSVATTFAEYAGEPGEALEALGKAAEALAAREDLRAEFRTVFRERARRAAPGSPDTGPSVEARKFSEYALARHLEEGTRAADYGTREKVARGDGRRVLDWYLEALSHFAAARECLAEATPAQLNALAAQGVVVRSLTDLLRGE